MQSLSRGNEQLLWLQGQIKGMITETSLPAVLIGLKISLLLKSDMSALISVVSHRKESLKYLVLIIPKNSFMELEFASFIFPPKYIEMLVQTFLCPSLLTTDLFSQLVFCEHPGSSPWTPVDSQLTSEKTFLEQILNQVYFKTA